MMTSMSPKVPYHTTPFVPIRDSRFTNAEIQDMADSLLAKGLHPAIVRHRLQERGIAWRYQFEGQGRRERLKRLKFVNRDLCTCGRAKPQTAALCEDCLDAKWAGGVHD